MTYSIIRYLVLALFVWLTAKGVITKDQADSSLPGIVDTCVLVVGIGGTILLSYLQKWYNGWLVENKPVPTNPTVLTQIPIKSDLIEK